MISKEKIFALKYNLLVNYPFISWLNRWARPRNIATYLLTRKKIQKYMRDKKKIKLNIGCGRVHLKGWINADISYGDIYLNASRRFPFSDATVSYIFSEHFIEHISQKEALVFLEECFRVLKPGGAMRLSTPDLQFYVNLYLSIEKEVTLDIFCSRISHIFPKTPDPCSFLNKILNEFGHQFNYDYKYFDTVLQSIGFSQIQRVKYGESQYSELKGLEQHSGVKWYQEKATLVIEAVK